MLREKLLHKKDRTVRCNVRKVDWVKYREELGRLVERMESELRGGIVGLEIEPRNAINSAAEVAIPNARGGIKKNRWWNKELVYLKKEVVRLKAKLRRNREYEIVMRNYREIRKRYSRLIRESKKASWIRFVEEEMEGNEWGKPYKMAVGKIRPREEMIVIGEVKKAGWEVTARALLDGLILDDSYEDETEYHKGVRLEVQEIRMNNRRVKIDEGKVRKAVWQCRSEIT